MAGTTQTASRDAEKYIVRFKPGMRSQIKANAARNNRTMNAEILFLLEKGMEVCYGGKKNG